MKTGIFGGSFNPVHNGHIYLAETILNKLNLDRIFFVPSGISPHRSSTEYAANTDRLEMLNLACKGNEKFIVCDYELNSERISYSIYTVEYFKEKFPEDELYLLIGSDMFLSFEKWYRFKDILKIVNLAVASREKDEAKLLEKKAEQMSEYGEIFICTTDPVIISSTKIRKKIAKNDNWTCYLNENVVQYIRLRGLYCQKILNEVNSLPYNSEEKKKYLKETLSQKRYIHSLNVADECKKLALKYGEDPDKAYFAGLLHDICKELSDEEQEKLVVESGFSVCREELETRSLWHAIAGAYVVKEKFGINDIDIINSIRFHTVGRSGMSRLEEIVYLGDLISDDRDYKEVYRMRKLAYSNLNAAMLEGFAFSVKSTVKKEGVLPLCTIEGYNFYIRICRDEKNKPNSVFKRGLK